MNMCSCLLNNHDLTVNFYQLLIDFAFMNQNVGGHLFWNEILVPFSCMRLAEGGKIELNSTYHPLFRSESAAQKRITGAAGQNYTYYVLSTISGAAPVIRF